MRQPWRQQPILVRLFSSSDFQPTNFHTYFCYLNYTPSINVSQGAVPVSGSQCFVIRNALYWIKIHAVFIEICQIKV